MEPLPIFDSHDSHGDSPKQQNTFENYYFSKDGDGEFVFSSEPLRVPSSQDNIFDTYEDSSQEGSNQKDQELKWQEKQQEILNKQKQEELNRLLQAMEQEMNLTKSFEEIGETFFYQKKPKGSKTVLKGYLPVSKKKVMAKILSPCSAEYKRMMLAASSMKNNNNSFGKYFLVPEFQLSQNDFKGEFLLKEIIDVAEIETMRIIVMEKMTGSFQDFIILRNELKMPLSDIELEFLLHQIINIGVALEKLQMYHSNITPSKFLFSYEKKQVLNQGDILLNSNETKLHEDIVLTDIGSLYEMTNINNYLDFSDPFLPFSELAPVNGYNAPEVLSFEEQLYPLKLNGFSIGLVALSLATLRIFKPLRFFEEFYESIESLKKSGYPRYVVSVILGLLDENPRNRFTSKIAADELERETNKKKQGF